MNKWDKRFIDLAEHIATWSKDPSTKVGAVIADNHNRVVSVGYNGFPRNVADCNERLDDRCEKYDLTIHGEMNAILFANRDLTGCTLYTYPLPPCVRCAAHIIQSGISRVVAPSTDNQRWVDSCNKARSLLEEAGVTVNWV
jgi:dCMP deaminase